MVNRTLLGISLLAIGVTTAAEIAPDANRLTVHEWGTFTSVAGPDGQPVNWLPLSGPSDLPCFVHRFDHRSNPKSAYGTVRMETPVVYFYPAHPMTASVHVEFPNGAITEWYPQAAKIPGPAGTQGRIEWNPIQLTEPGEALPREPGPSRYYAARETDAWTAGTHGERDKMLFYRGIGTFDVPLRAAVRSGAVEIRNTGVEEIPLVVVFVNRGGKSGYRAVRGVTGTIAADFPVASGDASQVRDELEASLAGSGLFDKEARAMLETWGDSWFEEGARVFYIVPRARVDAVLPLSIAPQPANTTRVFVGRVELLAPWMEDEIAAALRTGDTVALAKYGRFLNAFLRMMGDRKKDARVETWLQQKYREAAQEFEAKSCGQ